ncbi:MAG: hypothetical protein JNL70_06215 [Saprospiraceae bacterium]|nr:hypothetical protein [Saprospiraceae bacterium]
MPKFFGQIQLDPSVNWFNAVFHSHQILILGKKQGELWLARFDCIDYVEYYILGQLPDEAVAEWVSAPEHTENLLAYIFIPVYKKPLYLKEIKPIHLPPLYLKESIHFPNKVNILFLDWLPRFTIGAVMIENETVVILHGIGELKDKSWLYGLPMVLEYYSIFGESISVVPCQLYKDRPLSLSPIFWKPMIYRDGQYYVASRDAICVSINHSGDSDLYHPTLDMMAIVCCKGRCIKVFVGISEADGSYYLYRYDSKYWDNERENDIFGDKKKLEKLKAIGFAKKTFFTACDRMVDFYSGIDEESRPVCYATITLTASIISGFALGEQSNLCAFLTDDCLVTIYDLRN